MVSPHIFILQCGRNELLGTFGFLIAHNTLTKQETIFQSDLVEKTEFDKVKVSRILDKLEGRQLIERKRRGMTNVVVLK